MKQRLVDQAEKICMWVSPFEICEFGKRLYAWRFRCIG